MEVQPYVQRLLDRLDSPARVGDGWLCHCPSKGHGADSCDSTPSCRISIGEEGRILLFCRAGCETDAILQSLGIDYSHLWPAEGEQPEPCLVAEPVEPTEIEKEVRHNVYSWLLSRLTLSAEDRQNLLARGLEEADIARNEYATLDRAAVALLLPELVSEFGQTLQIVPGFRHDPVTTVRLVGQSEGILIPCRDRLGRILALKIRRRGDETSRYVYLSGGDGLSCGAILHHPVRVQEEWHDDYICITEGELKADIAAKVTNRFTLSLPGVGLVDRVLPWLAEAESPKQVRVALDWADVVGKRQVFERLASLVRQLQEAGYPTAVETWDGQSAKGIDDLYQAGGVPLLLEGEALTQRLEQLAASFTASQPRPNPWSPLNWAPWPFPSSILPNGLDVFVETVAKSKHTPVDFLGLGMFAVAGSIIGTTRAVEVIDGWLEFPCFYTCLVAEAGSRKTAALKTLMAPIHRWQEQAFLDHAANPDMPLRHYLTSDYTVEGVLHMLSSSPRGVMLYRDELRGWVLSDNQYRGGKGADRQFWLSLWSCDSYKKDRISTGSSQVNVPFMCVLGGIQPDLLCDLADKQGREDGFVHRLLFAMPRVEPRTGGLSRGMVSAAVRDSWISTAETLKLLDFAKLREDRPDPVVLGWTPTAFAEFNSWYSDLPNEMRRDDFPKFLRGPWAKLEAYCARIALVIRLLRNPDPDSLDPIERCDVQAAVCLVEYLKNHIAGVQFALRSKPHDDELLALLSLAQQSPIRQVTVREVMRSLRLATKSDTVALFKRAADLGLGEFTPFIHPISKRKTDSFLLPTAEDE